MKKNTWIYLGGCDGALWGSIFPLAGIGFGGGAVWVLMNGISRGHIFISVSLLGIAVFLGAFCIILRDRFYSWAKFGQDGVFVWTLFAKKRYQRYDRYQDAGVCRYIHGDLDDADARKAFWIYLTTDTMRPLYVRNINRMPITVATVRMPFTEERYTRLISVLPGGLSDKLRMSRAKLFSEET